MTHPSSPVTGFVVEDRDGTELLTLTIPGLVVRLLTVAPVATALAVLYAIAPGAAWWPSAAVLLLAVLSAELPDSGAGLATLGGLVGWWLVAVPEPAVWWALVISGCCLVFHVVLAHAAAGPSGAGPTRAVVGRLTMRCAVVLVLTAGVAAVVEVAEEWGEPPALAVGITLALAGALPWFAAPRGR
jgi:hypothetical protein